MTARLGCLGRGVVLECDRDPVPQHVKVCLVKPAPR